MQPFADLQSNLGRRVRALRTGRGWSRRELAQRSRMSERFLADLERGHANPSLLRLAGLAAALEIELPRLLRPESSRQVLALLGLRGAGKSTVGAALGRKLGAPFVELDVEIEVAAGLRLSEIFELHGEDYYRRVERDALRSVLDRRERIVLATGGGIVTEPATFELLRERAHTVWLRAAPEDHWRRVIAQGDLRPMAGNETAFASLRAILAERERRYCEAELSVDTTGRSVAEVVAELYARFAAGS